MSAPAFPFVDCVEHGRQRSYAVCEHVYYGKAAPAHFVLASDRDMGELMCAVRVHHWNEFKVCCAEHVRGQWGAVLVFDDRSPAATT